MQTRTQESIRYTLESPGIQVRSKWMIGSIRISGNP
jgi:hypothetical protein